MDQGFDIQTYISVTLGGLLTISEIFPFIQKIESNGIVDLLMNIGSKYLNRMKNSNTTTRSELERLIGDENNERNDNDNQNQNHEGTSRIQNTHKSHDSQVLTELNDIRESLNEIKSCIVNIKTVNNNDS